MTKRGVFEKTPLLKSPKTFTAENFIFGDKNFLGEFKRGTFFKKSPFFKTKTNKIK